MKSSEWLQICGKIADLWPNQPWNPNTAAAAYPLFEAISAQAAHEAVEELAAKGREWAPVPGLVLVHAQAFEANLRPALPDPDLTRDLSPEEKQRAQAMAVKLRSKIRELAAAKAL